MLKRFISAVLCVMLALSSTIIYYAETPGYSVEAAVDYETPYYYNQMSKDAQKAYNELKKAALECKKKIKLNVSIDQADFDMIAEMLMLHDPVTFNVKNLEASDVTNRSATFTIQYKYTKESYEKMVASYNKKVDAILAKLTDDMSTYNKIRTIHDEIIKTTAYDMDSSSCENIYGTLVKKKSKCDGYAKTFAYICAKAGIRTVTVIGDASQNNKDELHMWNKVYYNKKWYNVDVTWDDPVNNLKKNHSYSYFMISDAAIQKSHTENNLSFAVPKASDNSKNYFKVGKKYAEDLNSAKSIMKSSLTTAVKNKTTYIEFKCASKSVFDSTLKYLGDSEKVCGMLSSVKKNTGSKLVTDVYSYSYNDDVYTIRLLVFYDKTSLKDYYLDTSSVSKDMLKALSNNGIK